MQAMLAELLDEHPLVRDCDVIVDKGSICGWARRNPSALVDNDALAEKGGLGGGPRGGGLGEEAEGEEEAVVGVPARTRVRETGGATRHGRSRTEPVLYSKLWVGSLWYFAAATIDVIAG